MVGGYEQTLRKLSVRDDRLIEQILAHESAGAQISGMDAKSHSLVVLGALVASNAAPPSFMSAVEDAARAGATVDEMVGTLIAVMPAIGVSRVVAAAPNLALAMGYDVAAALEEHEGDVGLLGY